MPRAWSKDEGNTCQPSTSATTPTPAARLGGRLTGQPERRHVPRQLDLDKLVRETLQAE